jgi:tetratricopeptide (TPR) repeat protein
MKVNFFYLAVFIVALAAVVIVAGIAISPQGLVYFDNRGDFYYKKGEYQKAAEEYKKIINRDPYIIQAYHKLGRIYLRKGFYNKAKAVYQAALAKDPNFIEIINDLCNPKVIMSLYTKVRMSPFEIAIMIFSKGGCYGRRRHYYNEAGRTKAITYSSKGT